MAPPRVDPYLKARRALKVAQEKFLELEERWKSAKESPPVVQKRAPGRPPVPLDVQMKRARAARDEALEQCRKIERERGTRKLSIPKLCDVDDYAAKRGRPAGGQIGYIHKELRRHSDRLAEIKATPDAEYNEALNKWHATPGKRGRRPKSKDEMVIAIQNRIDDLRSELDSEMSKMSDDERRQVELDQARIHRRNLIAEVNTLAHTDHTDPDQVKKRTRFLRTKRGAPFRTELEQIDDEIRTIESKMTPKPAPKARKARQSLTEENRQLKQAIKEMEEKFEQLRLMVDRK